MKIDIFTKAMGCTKLTYQNFSFLQVIHPKKKVSAEKKRIKKYVGNYVYENNVLQFFNHAEGYVTPDCSGGFDYVYQYKDHLGNVRLSYSDANNNGTIEVTSDPLTTEIIEENNYYPFGLEHKGYNNVITSTNPAQDYKYNGKELNDELGLNWYDYGARNYDAALGRWMNVDVLAEDYYEYSPYNYTLNNPIRFIDPDGNGVDDIIITGSATAIEKYNNTVSAGTGGFYTVDIDSSGKVGLSETGIGNLGVEMTAEQKAFYDDYSAVVNSSDVVSQEVVESDTGTVVDSWHTGKIDMTDIAEFDKSGNGAASSAGALIHSTVEQHEKVKLGLSSGDIGATSTDARGNTVYTDYLKSHKTAISAENRANGNYRGVGGNEDVFLEKNGTKTQQTLTTTPTGGVNIVKTKIK